MIKRIFFNTLILLSITACDKSRTNVSLSNIKTETNFIRFDKAFFTTDTSDFNAKLVVLKKDYPPFFKSGETERFWKLQRMDKRQNELYREVDKQLKPFSNFDEQLNIAMKYFYAYFKEHNEIKVYTYISNLDFNLPSFYNDSTKTCFIATDLYLGQNQPYYAFLPNYLAYYRQPAFMVRDCMEAIAKEKVPPISGNVNLLDHMIYHGKILYLTQLFMPQLNEAVIMKYPNEKAEFCLKNERSVWSYFVENQLLFSTKSEDIVRFINTAPFSRFGMRFDNQSPGQIGQWIGLQIVKNYMDRNPKVSISDLLKEKNSQKILKLSGYRPK